MKKIVFVLVLSGLVFAIVNPGRIEGPQFSSFHDSYSSVINTIPFDFYSTQDNLGRQIDFYISNTSQTKLPLVLFIQGSGCTSNFRKMPDGKIAGGYQNVLLQLLQTKAHVMVVEKPYVKFLDFNDDPGSAIHCSLEFNKNHTLEGWTSALKAALTYAMSLSKVDSHRIIVIGHSEGAISAASLAAHEPSVTDVALLSGSGPSQLFDFIVNKTQSEIDGIYSALSEIQADPLDAEAFFYGHPYRRWSSFFSNSTVDLLENTSAHIMLVHGTNDVSVPVQSFDVLVSDLLRRQRRIDYERIKGADHALNLPGENSPTGMERGFRQILSWCSL